MRRPALNSMPLLLTIVAATVILVGARFDPAAPSTVVVAGPDGAKPASCMQACMHRVFTEPYSRVGQSPPPLLCRDPYEQHCASKCAVSVAGVGGGE